jgi:hypothetical protein
VIPGAIYASYAPPNGLTTTTSYRRYVKDATCNTTPTVSAGTWTVTVREKFSTGSISSTGEPVCYNGDPAMIGSILPATGGDGNITYKWQVNDIDIDNTNSATYDPPSGVTASYTLYRRYAKDATCNTTFVKSDGNWEVTLKTLPTVSARDTKLCFSENSQQAVINYTSSANLTTYSIVWNGAGASVLGSVTNAILPAGSFSVSVPANTPVGTYTGNLTVTNDEGCTSIADEFSITVTASPTISTSGLSDAVCYGSYSLLAYNSTTLNPTNYSIDWEESTLSDISNRALNASPISVDLRLFAGTHKGILTVANAEG